MRVLTQNQRLVLAALIAEVKTTGTPPTHARLVELCPEVPRGSIASTVHALTRRGFIEPASYANSPIKPLRNEHGAPITISVEVEQ